MLSTASTPGELRRERERSRRRLLLAVRAIHQVLTRWDGLVVLVAIHVAIEQLALRLARGEVRHLRIVREHVLPNPPCAVGHRPRERFAPSSAVARWQHHHYRMVRRI